MENKIKALAEHLGIDADEVEETSYDDCTFEADGGEYMVLTDDEADQLWDESLDSYIDECILPEMPEHLAGYFDYEKWKRDARMDGRGHCLNHYDSGEDEIEIDGEYFYIYRIN